MNKLNYIGGGGYAAPTLEVLDLVVEQGFAASPVATTEEGVVNENDWWDR